MTGRSSWFVYVLDSRSTQSTYVGITTDPERRLEQHNGETPGGAKSTRAGRPWQLAVTAGPFDSRSDAQRVEHHVKKLRRSERLRWEPTA